MITAGRCVDTDNVFVVPILNLCLLYAPLHAVAALVAPTAVDQVRDALLLGKSWNTSPLRDIVELFRAAPAPVPRPKRGDLTPAFLGLIPTRSCNLACEYCGFLTPAESSQVMDLELARTAIEWYLNLVGRSGAQTAEVHFFGGEPFCADEVVEFAYHFARLKAADVGCTVRFEVATNGTFDEDRCRWAADSLDSIVLSLDGPADIQDRYRHRRDGRGSFEAVARSARILSEGSAELSLRVCVTAETVDRMPAMAAWFCHEFRPASVCFEPVQPSALSEDARLIPPDPWQFARGFVEAARILEAHGVAPVYAAADIAARRVSFCPVGQDVPIVSPDGSVTACYLLHQEWEAKGFDLRLGRVENGAVLLDDGAVTSTRSLNVWNKPFCARCFARWHCAGGCHVNHSLSHTPGDYDRLCLQTRAITLRNVLKALDHDDLTRELLEDPPAWERAVRQASDLIADWSRPA
jgi:uncharacterized protein